MWSPDGNHVAYAASDSNAPLAVHRKLASGAGADEIVHDGQQTLTVPVDWSSDGTLSATGAGNAWMTARKDAAAGRGVSLFERTTEGGVARWVEHGIGERAVVQGADRKIRRQRHQRSGS